MEIMIPVTKVLKQKKTECQIQPQMDERTQRQRAKTQKPLQFSFRTLNLPLQNQKVRVKSNRVHIKNQDQDANSHQNAIQAPQRSKEQYFNSTLPKFQRKIDCQMQKKSTQSSLHEDPKPQNHELEHPEEVSSANMVICKSQTYSKQKEAIKVNFELEKDEYNEDLQKSCKICLGGDNLNQIQSNPLTRVCKCKDYVHLECLQEWINHRDILHGNSRINQCQVCRQLYHFELQTEGFLSSQVFRKKVSSSPFKAIFKFLLIFGLFVLSTFCIYLFIELLVEGSGNGGYVQQTLKIPFGTCLVVMILISTVGALIFIIFAHNFLTSFCLDVKYKIGKITQQNSKESSRNLNNMVDYQDAR